MSSSKTGSMPPVRHGPSTGNGVPYRGGIRRPVVLMYLGEIRQARLFDHGAFSLGAQAIFHTNPTLELEFAAVVLLRPRMRIRVDDRGFKLNIHGLILVSFNGCTLRLACEPW